MKNLWTKCYTTKKSCKNSGKTKKPDKKLIDFNPIIRLIIKY